MKNACRLIVTALAVVNSAAWAIPLQGTQGTQEPTKPAVAQQSVDIVETAAKSEDLKTFTQLVQKAGLSESLKGKGPFTVLAPTDEAFKKLPEGLLDKLSANPELLKKVLTYHVLPTKVEETDLKDATETKTLQGEPIKVAVEEKTDPATNAPEKTVTLNDKTAKVIKADVEASNGVIHEIDALLVPPSLAARSN